MPRRKDLKPGCAEYKREWEYQKKTGEDKKQLERAKARRVIDNAGISRKGKDVDHIKPLENGGTSDLSNLRIVDSSKNQSRNGHKKGEGKK